MKGEVVGRLARDGIGANVLGDPRVALTWLVNELSALGLTLRAGEVVTTGTCLVPLEIPPGDRVAMDFGALGRVECRMAFVGRSGFRPAPSILGRCLQRESTTITSSGARRASNVSPNFESGPESVSGDALSSSRSACGGSGTPAFTADRIRMALNSSGVRSSVRSYVFVSPV